MATSRINFTEWLPDQPGVIGALTVAKNVFPKAVGYGAFPASVEFSLAASEDLNAVVAARDSDGTTRIIAGGNTKLFLLDSADLSLDDISGTTYSSSNDWKFTQFGNSLIAANGAEKIQYYDLTTTGDFEDIDAGAPTVRFLTVVRDFVVTGFQPTNKSRVQWSGINDPTTWSSSGVTQSDFQDIPDGGQIQGVTGGEFGLVLLERSIVRMSYVGSPLVFQFDNISRNLGCYEPNSVVQWQGITYFLGDDGFYACDGQNVVSIGAEKVDRFFFTDADEGSFPEMSTAVDPIRNLVMWGYRNAGDLYRLLVYHVNTKRWSFIDTSINRLSSYATPAITLEGVDTYSASIDALTIPLDSRFWQGGKLLLGGVSGTKIVTFSGSSLTATIETADLENEGQSSMITLARPIIDEGSASVAIASRNSLNQAITFGGANQPSSENRVSLRSLGRYHRLRVEPTGDWSNAIGLDIEIQPAGMR
jgi:hypothetical protein